MGYDLPYILDAIASCMRVIFMTKKSPDTEKCVVSEEIANLKKLAGITVFVANVDHCLSEDTEAKILIQSDLLKEEKIKVRIRGKLRTPFESNEEQAGKTAVGFIPEVIEILDAVTNECFQTIKLF